ncbi:MAG: copper homeostasis protein CutC [Flavobacteriaceae bacterium]|jgi:copper homeostasis protein
MLVEVCVASLSSISNAEQAGADRIELCSALEVGGLTPSAGFIKEAVGLNSLPIHCLIRPRQGHFYFSKEEIKIIENNIQFAADAGCSGVVLGAHNSEFKLDYALLKKWKALAGGMYCTFHRAFDVLVDPEQALEQLIDLGFDCVLTSGQFERAEEGFENLNKWNTQYGQHITIMPGSGVSIENCLMFKQAEFKALHLSGSSECPPLVLPDGVNQSLSFLNQPLRESNTEVLKKFVQKVKTS